MLVFETLRRTFVLSAQCGAHAQCGTHAGLSSYPLSATDRGLLAVRLVTRLNSEVGVARIHDDEVLTCGCVRRGCDVLGSLASGKKRNQRALSSLPAAATKEASSSGGVTPGLRMMMLRAATVVAAWQSGERATGRSWKASRETTLVASISTPYLPNHRRK